MEQQPKIPTLKDAQKPQVKIKGMGAGLTLFDRLKQFKKKDLAFILAGLGTLFMAPLAEHFMMAPENGNMEAGFRGAGSGGSGSNLFGTGSSPYENQGGIAQGGPSGGAGDIITPLNVRDPSALVMGPGAAQQPPAGSGAAAAPPPTAPTTSNEDLKDAIAHSAARAGSAAVKKAPLPIPKIAVGGSGLRGLGAASGGNSSGSGSLGNIGGLGGGTAGTGGGGLNLVRSAPNFKGVAGPRGPNSPSGLDGTKKAGANAGDAFSRTGSALSGLNAAASEQIPTGGQGFGGGGQGGSGANDKPGGGTGAAGSKSVGESLAFIEAKERMMENLKLEFEKRKLKDPELLLYGIRNDSLKAMAAEMTKALTKATLGLLSDAAGAKKTIACPPGSTAKPLSVAESNTCNDGAKFNCYKSNGNTGEWNYQGAEGTPSIACAVTTAEGTTGPSNAEQAARAAQQGRVTAGAGAVPGSVNDVCTRLADTNHLATAAEAKAAGATPKDTVSEGIAKKEKASSAGGMLTIGNLNQVQNALYASGAPPTTTCKGADGLIKPTSPAKSVNEHLMSMRDEIGGADGKGGLVKTLKDSIGPKDPADAALGKAKTDAERIAAELIETKRLLADAQKALVANPELKLPDMLPSQVATDQAKYQTSWNDSDKLAKDLDAALKKLEPAVQGIVAAASKVASAPNGSTKAVVDASLAFDQALEKAKTTKIKDAKGADTKDTVLTDADITKAKQARNTAPEGDGKTPPAADAAAAVDHVKLADDVGKKANTGKEAVDAEVKKLGTGSVDETVASAFKKSVLGDLPKGIAEAIKMQNDVLDGVGAASNASTTATPKKP